MLGLRLSRGMRVGLRRQALRLLLRLLLSLDVRVRVGLRTAPANSKMSELLSLRLE